MANELSFITRMLIGGDDMRLDLDKIRTKSMKALLSLFLLLVLFLPLASAKPQIQVSGPIYGIPEGVSMGQIVYTDYYRGDNVIGWNNQTSYAVTLNAHSYYSLYTEYTATNGTSGDCIGTLGKFSNTSPLNTPLFLACYEG